MGVFLLKLIFWGNSDGDVCQECWHCLFIWEIHQAQLVFVFSAQSSHFVGIN